MRSSASSAQPLALLNLGSVYATDAQTARQQALHLEHILRHFAATCTEYPHGISGAITHAWQRNLDALRTCGSFAVQVGQQFLSADRGGVPALTQWLQSAPPTLTVDLSQLHDWLRREQIKARLRANTALNSAQMEQDGTAERQEAQATLAYYIETMAPSALHSYDLSFFRLSAWTALVRADFKRKTALDAQVEQAELELELLELEYALAVRAGHNDRILFSLETQLATLRLQLDGDPTFTLYPDYLALVEQRTALQQRWGLLAAEYHNTKAIPEQDALAAQTRPPGASAFDNLYPQKQMLIKPEDVLYKYADGRRIVSMDGKITTVVSDIDIGDYTVGDKWVSNEEFIGSGGFMERNTELTGFNNINHGPLSRGLTMDNVLAAQGARKQEFLDEQVYVLFKKADGTVETLDMPYWRYLETYNKEALKAINSK